MRQVLRGGEAGRCRARPSARVARARGRSPRAPRYQPSAALEKLQEKNVETRTQLQLERESKQQREELLSFVQHSTAERDAERRDMETKEKQHRSMLQQMELEQEVRARQTKEAAELESLKARALQEVEMQRLRHDEELRHFTALKGLGVDLTKVIVASSETRPDRVFRVETTDAGGNVHLHTE